MAEMSKQLSLFDIFDETPREKNRLGKQILKGVIDAEKATPPDYLMELISSETLEQFVRLVAGLKGIQDEEPLLRIPAGWRANVYAASVNIIYDFFTII